MQRCGIQGKCSVGNRAYYGSFNGNGDRQPNIICENQGGVHHPGLQLDPGSLRVVGHLRHGGWQGMWGFPSYGHIGGHQSGKQQFPN